VSSLAIVIREGCLSFVTAAQHVADGARSPLRHPVAGSGLWNRLL
jgi:hypothetical protein